MLEPPCRAGHRSFVLVAAALRPPGASLCGVAGHHRAPSRASRSMLRQLWAITPPYPRPSHFDSRTTVIPPGDLASSPRHASVVASPAAAHAPHPPSHPPPPPHLTAQQPLATNAGCRPLRREAEQRPGARGSATQPCRRPATPPVPSQCAAAAGRKLGCRPPHMARRSSAPRPAARGNLSISPPRP
ncbi:unnamed protein product [Urochloa humidicola]